MVALPEKVQAVTNQSMERAYRSWQRRMVTAVLGMLGFVGGCVALLGLGAASIPRAMNDGTLAEQTARLDALEIDADAEVARHAEVGLQVCCSNHCDFFSGRAYDLPPGVVVDPPGGFEVVREPIPDNWSEISGFQSLRTAAGSPAPGLQRVYVVGFAQHFEGFAFDWDLRCH